MEERTLSIREIANAYLEHNGLTIAYMARVTKIPDATLRYWLDGVANINQKNLIKVKEFLKGDFLLDVETIINHMLIEREGETDEN